MPVQTSNEESNAMEDKESKQNKFLYQGKRQKTGPWRDWEESPHHVEIQSNGNPSNILKQNSNKGLDLESVWSVKKNVPLPANKRQSNTNKVAIKTGTSYYSRHVTGLVGSKDHQSQDLKSHSTKNNDVGHDNRSWNFKKPGYSYGSSGSATKRPAGDDEDNEFDHFENKKKVSGGGITNTTPAQNRHKNTTPPQIRHVLVANKAIGSSGSVTTPERKASARTQRAQKMHAAHLKSSGLGDFTPEISQYEREEKPSGVNWKTKLRDDDKAF